MIYIIIAILVITNAIGIISCVCMSLALRGIILYLMEAGIQPPDREQVKEYIDKAANELRKVR